MKRRNLFTTVFAISTLILGLGLLSADAQTDNDLQNAYPYWSELIASMDKMHMAMKAVSRSGNSDVDFVRLMIPHHQAALEMAKAQLLYGTDPQMRRLAQEIITDQQLEIQLMQLWLRQHELARAKANRTQGPASRKDN